MRRNADYLICHTAVIGLALLCWPVPAGANPVGGRVAQGTATITSQGSQLTINTSDRAAINWASFNIGLGETTSFVQPSSSSVVWNYINNPLPSQILGNLNANGYLILQSPAGFYVGGNAAISAHGLVMTTSPTPAPVLSTSSPWQFNAPPPTASIINYGQIRTDGVAGGSLFLIAANVINAVDTVHGYVGSISAPQGNIGLFAGQQVMISTRADGRGLNARVTLPQGTVDNEGNITADAGMIALRAQTVNQGGLVQANSARSVNGVIELVASDTLTLGAGSVISAQGNAPAGTASPGGSVVLSGRTFIDQPTSQINVAGQSGAPNGLVQIFGNGTTLNSIMSTIDGESAADFAAGNLLLLNTYNLTLSSGPTDTSSSNPTLSVDDLAAYSKLALFAKHDILLNTWWYLPDSPDPNSWLTLEAGRNIALSDGSAAQAGRNWHFNFTAGTGLAAGSTPTPRTYGIYLTGTSFIESQNGDIDLWAANDVSVATGFAASVANNGIRTLAGGNIDVTTIYGNVNTGGNPLGYQYQLAAPYYSVISPNTDLAGRALGGISTAAGGNLTINSGKDVISFLPVSSYGALATSDGGSGAFGPEPGNVTITAAGNVYGHYVVANGKGVITAGGNVGSPIASKNLALSLIRGSWEVNAPNGSIYLQEIRNPNGIFNNFGVASSRGRHLFGYDPHASLSLNAGDGVYLTGLSLPRWTTDPVPVLFPPLLNISAGAGGIVLDTDVTLFPSPAQGLTISTTGNFEGEVTSQAPQRQLLMSDSSHTRWTTAGDFGTRDHGSFPLTLNNPDPVVVDVSGNMENLTLLTTKRTTMWVGGDMNNCGFSGENLHPSDITSIQVGGRIYNRGPYSFVYLAQAIPVLPTADFPGGRYVPFDYVFNLLLDPARVASLRVPTHLRPSQWAGYVASAASLLPGNAGASSNPGFIYNPSTGRLGFAGQMSLVSRLALESSAVVLRYNVDGTPATYIGRDGHQYFVTDRISFLPRTAVEALYTASQGAPSPALFQTGYRLGGPGTFDIQAGSISLGNSMGILSCGVAEPGQGGFARYGNLARLTPSGATLNVTVDGNLDMLTSTIASLGGGAVNVTSLSGSMDLGSQELFSNSYRELAFGIFTSGHSDVNVIAAGDININGSRIAAYNGGNILVESLLGDVNAGTGGTSFVTVWTYFVDPLTGQAARFGERVFGSGIVANTLIRPYAVPDGAVLPGNIRVLTPRGSIYASIGGILQEALNGNFSGGPTVTLIAGTRPSANSPGYVGNIDLGESGVIGGSVYADANGNISGLVISRQNATINAAQSFNGTVLAGGTANLTAGGTISGTIVGIGGINASGGEGVSATLLSQSVSVGGASQTQNTLGASATATTTSQAASQQATTETARSTGLADTAKTDDDKKKNNPVPTLVRRVGRVTVLLPPLPPG